MIRFRFRMNDVLSLILPTELAVAIALGGCKTQAPDVYDWRSDRIFTRAIRETAETDDLPSDVRRRTQVALLRLENGVLDPEPILIRAWVSNFYDDYFLEFIVLDEDKDLLGLRIREQYTDVNCAVTTLDEDYPVYIGFRFAPFTSWNSMLVKIRYSNQRKDEKLWQEYMNKAPDWLSLYKRRHDDRGKTPLEVVEEGGPKEPPIWISVPKPNKVRVFLSVYDRAGNKSESVEVEY